MSNVDQGGEVQDGNGTTNDEAPSTDGAKPGEELEQSSPIE